MTRTEAVEYVRRWAEARNRRNIEAVLGTVPGRRRLFKPESVAATRPERSHGSNNERYVIQLAGTLR